MALLDSRLRLNSRTSMQLKPERRDNLQDGGQFEGVGVFWTRAIVNL